MIEYKLEDIINKLEHTHSLSVAEYQYLIEKREEKTAKILAEAADRVRRRIYQNHIFIRGLIEVSNICRNDCLYCGIRKDNGKIIRYRLSLQQILDCCKEGYLLGFRTFVLQGGEGCYSVEDICEIVSEIKQRYQDCAVTLSLGEFSREEYSRMYRAGAERYLLRHETACETHYKRLHPESMSYKKRMNCLRDLKELGFQVGCGFMVGSPYQKAEYLAEDLKFVETFSPEMCGIGPFIPQKDTPLGNFSSGTVELTTYLLSILRLIKPDLLLPATTALGTIDKYGRQRGILAGANVVMPNLSPISQRENYALYDHKQYLGGESAQSLDCLKKEMAGIGYEVVISRGDPKKFLQ